MGPVRPSRTGTAPASDVGVGGDDDGPDPGRYEQTGLVGRVGSASRPCLPRIRRSGRWHAPAGRLRPPRAPEHLPNHDPPGTGEGVRYGWGQRRAVSSGPPEVTGGGGPPVRPGNPGPVAPDDRPARAPPGRGARLHALRCRPLARPRGAIRGWSLAGRLRKAGRATAVRTPPSRMVDGQTAAAVSVGSTSAQEEPSSAERATASSTSWTCNASAKEGVGSTPVATASMKSRISCVNECS